MTDLSAYETKDALAAAVAEAISEKLRAAIEARGMASFVASGGGTPKPAFELLSQDDRIDWNKVTVTLSDERMAPPEAGVSNANMLREHLLKDAAASARFLPLDTLSSLEKFDLPFDVVLLGMGGDGHFASIFPDGDGMEAACAPGATILAETIPHPLPPEAPYPRLTLSLPAIRQCRDLFLMVSGKGKRDILELAGSDAPEGALPIRRLLHDPDLPLSIFWAPQETPMPTHSAVQSVIDRIEERSRETRAEYLDKIEAMRRRGKRDGHLSCGNLAHAYAAAPAGDKLRLRTAGKSLGIVTSYNDMLSAHAPYEDVPKLLRDAARKAGAVAQVAGGTPAMCDGVTQGQDGMELSLFSRDVIAMATAIALTHDTFDAALCLGVCDKIVPGLFIGAASFGHLPILFVPAGPMTSGLPNKEKARIRGLYAEGKIGRAELLEGEMASYHSQGTCTFYGTANSNQMMMEVMGFHLPGAAFVNPNTPLREALTRAAATHVLGMEDFGMAEMTSAATFTNAIVGLHATGGSTNHTLHIIAMARAAGYLVTWEDFSDLSDVTPLLARVYPNGAADVNHFHAAGGMAFVISELRKEGLLSDDCMTAMGKGLAKYGKEPFLKDGELVWRDGPDRSLNEDILRPITNPFQHQGGLKLLTGNLGKSVIKSSAVAPEHRIVEAPAIVFHDQDEFLARFKAGDLDRDFVAVVRFQGPAANGMPELHKLSPQLGLLQDRGHKVALVTDGRMSGASGKTPAAIHVTPEALHEGPIARIQDGDIIRLDAEAGTLEAKVDDLMSRPPVAGGTNSHDGVGRELFGGMRAAVSRADEGACTLFQPPRACLQANRVSQPIRGAKLSLPQGVLHARCDDRYRLCRSCVRCLFLGFRP